MNNKNRISINGKYQELYGHFDFESTYDIIADNLKTKDIFVEIGSAWGKSAIYMMEKLHAQNKLIDFYCVDIFTQEDDIDNLEFPFGNGKEYRMKFKNQTLYYDFIYNISNSYAKDFKPMPIRTYSDLAANLFEDNSCKAIFLDAAHDYESVAKDLEAWWPKIKNGGILSGHDFYGKENGFSEENGVAKALNIFLKRKALKINHINSTTFIINKNEDGK